MRSFDDGRRHDFFVLWERFIPASLRRHNLETQKVRFCSAPLWDFFRE